MFTVVMTPIMFTGATQFPLLGLDSLRWYQMICSLNPLTYISEATRSLVGPPGSSRCRSGCACVSLTGVFVAFSAIGMRGFMRRAMD
ncbi:hypothetical protein V2I01_31445 [Micromonospora sp. BRA006-A]|nr:hypothetical protein [Micromonospora sp. BRA006-A]